MAVTTVAQFAAQLGRPTTALIEQLQSAGVTKQSPEDALTDADKERLLDFLRNAHGTTAGAERKKITLTRKTSTEIKQADSSGRARTIQVEVRKKRVFVKRDDAPAAAEEPSGPSAEELDLQRREEEARAQAEAIRVQEEELAQARRLREEQERAAREAAEAAAAEAARRAAEVAAAEAAAAAAASPAGKGKAGAAAAAAATPA
ncbi:MAG: translation initiation factor IF-2 associated domain-containing protein, partial [Burkholderiales bacterium]|nr:translation initiation factor IF-2 associated domain-containing protein [Burkholderiales bacterium]